ncbi:unnamed protein product [Musa acuminata subsp. malaccensis]|nr:PREDICTED: uncharacterized protein LOC103973604 isoform X1 [Musa acuminata subsp. malaccensis]CAG1860189.1 unnamed protein product [Musa acuminata subsp. malaccensis]
MSSNSSCKSTNRPLASFRPRPPLCIGTDFSALGSLWSLLGLYMVFNQNEQSFADHTSDQFNCEHVRHLSYDGQLHVRPFAEGSTCEDIPAKSPVSDQERGFSSYHIDFENVIADPPSDNSYSNLSGKPSFSRVTGNNSEVIWLENGKRSLCDDETCLCASKRLKRVDQNFQLGSSEDVCFSNSKKSLSVTAEDLKDGGTAAVAEDAIDQTTTSHWFAQSSSREAGLDPPVRVPSYPFCYGDIRQAAEFDQVEEIYSPVFGYFDQKHIAIGSNHQADVPEWRFYEFKNHIGDHEDCAFPGSSPLCDDHIIDEDDSDKWNGTCVMPMPDCALLASDSVGLHYEMNCGCLDEASIRCVRQHVVETREKLRRNLGQDRFLEFGFADMGEVVAEGWTEEEQQLFHEIVLSNPASAGKNFWDILPRVFPARNSKELVSYYFNVFMLRKRAEQNRLDPLHVDSDDDEWQENDDGEFTMAEDEDEEDSVVESLADQDNVPGEEDDIVEEDITEEADDVEDCNCYTLARNNEKRTCGDVKGCIGSDPSLPPGMQFTGSNLHHCVEEQDMQDDSCTSYEGQRNGADSCNPVDIFDSQHSLNEDHENFRKEYQNGNLSGLMDNGFFDSLCDPKAWDTSYCCESEKDDLLPTCNVIEEVFGKEC